MSGRRYISGRGQPKSRSPCRFFFEAARSPFHAVAHQRITLAWPPGRAVVGLRDRRPESSLSGCPQAGAQLER